MRSNRKQGFMVDHKFGSLEKAVSALEIEFEITARVVRPKNPGRNYPYDTLGPLETPLAVGFLTDYGDFVFLHGDVRQVKAYHHQISSEIIKSTKLKPGFREYHPSPIGNSNYSKKRSKVSYRKSSILREINSLDLKKWKKRLFEKMPYYTPNQELNDHDVIIVMGFCRESVLSSLKRRHSKNNGNYFVEGEDYVITAENLLGIITTQSLSHFMRVGEKKLIMLGVSEEDKILIRKKIRLRHAKKVRINKGKKLSEI